MKNGKFKVAYLDHPPHPAFLEAMRTATDIDLICISTDDDPAAVTRALAECEGYYVQAAKDELPMVWQVTEDFLSQMPKLLVVSSYGAGYDTVDIDACIRYGVAACNQAGGNAEAVSQQTLAYILSLLKRIPEGDAAVRQGTALDRNRFMGRELFGRTVGVVGLGHIGTRVAHYLKAFNCKVLAYDPYVDAETCAARGAEKVDFDTLLSESDIVSVHCPLTAETRNMFSAGA
ncbi:MAG: NAD(P)-dependent oxidoreductase, partial [Pseudomonadota bacterium]